MIGDGQETDCAAPSERTQPCTARPDMSRRYAVESWKHSKTYVGYAPQRFVQRWAACERGRWVVGVRRVGDAVGIVEGGWRATEDEVGGETRLRTSGPAGGCKRVIDARHISSRWNWEAAGRVVRQGPTRSRRHLDTYLCARSRIVCEKKLRWSET